jgi:hypothetical protein
MQGMQSGLINIILAISNYLHQRFRGNSHLPGMGNFSRRHSCFQNAYIVRFNEIHGLYITETDALGIAVAEVALEDHFIDDVVVHGPEGADGHTGAATDAECWKPA